eukprot:UN23205
MPLDKVYPAHVESSSYDTYVARYLTKIPDPPIYLDRGVSSTVVLWNRQVLRSEMSMFSLKMILQPFFTAHSQRVRRG